MSENAKTSIFAGIALVLFVLAMSTRAPVADDGGLGLGEDMFPEFEDSFDVRKVEIVEFDEGQGVPLEVPAGTLVVLHGALPHYSAANHSNKSRYAYTLHTISATAQYPKDNWLRRDDASPWRLLGASLGNGAEAR